MEQLLADRQILKDFQNESDRTLSSEKWFIQRTSL